MRRAGLVGAVVLAACGGGASEDGATLPPSGATCADSSSTIRLWIVPSVVERGEAVTIEAVWEVLMRLEPPVRVTFVAGTDDEIEVEMPLEKTLPNPHTNYQGVLLNPFGVGVPPGEVSAVATAGTATGCEGTPTAVTTFDLR